MCVDGKLTSKTTVTTKFSNNQQQRSENVQGKIVLFLQGECVEFFVFRYNLTVYYVSVESSPFFCKKQKKKVKKKISLPEYYCLTAHFPYWGVKRISSSAWPSQTAEYSLPVSLLILDKNKYNLSRTFKFIAEFVLVRFWLICGVFC